MKRLVGFLSWMVSLITPVALVLAAVRLVLNPWFVEFEYRTPGFPADPYGFSQQDRLRYAHIALDYLLNDADISFLGDLRFPEGEQAPLPSCQYMDDCTRLYNDRELQHMLDVKMVVRATLRVWYGALLILALLGVWAWRAGWGESYRRGLARGGWLTLILIVLILALVVAAFQIFFIAFHEVFFQPGTWSFLTSDTLIRLFPERFWRDTFLVVGSLSAALGLILVVVAGSIGRRGPKSVEFEQIHVGNKKG